MTDSGHFLIAATLAAIILVGGSTLTKAVSNPDAQVAEAGQGETTQVKITRALSAGPDDVAGAARVVDIDAYGKMIVLREGTNGFTCIPGDPIVIGDPPMCVDAAPMQWAADFKAHKPTAAP